MLKKNIFVAIFSLILCLSVFCGNLTRDSLRNKEASAIDLVELNEFSGEGWGYDCIDTLTLTNYNGLETLKMPTSAIKVNMNGSSVIEVKESGVGAMQLNGGGVSFIGSGSLELLGDPAIVYSSTTETITLGTNIKVCIDDCVNCKDTITVSELQGATKVKFYNSTVHQHSFEYTANGAELVAECVEDGCDLQNNKITTALLVEDVVYGNTVSYELNLDEFLSEGLDFADDFTFEYYKVETKGDVTGGEFFASATEVGYYYLKATSNSAIIGEKTLVCAFEIKNPPTEIVSIDKTIKYDGLKYNLSQMFAFDGNEGSLTYSIVEQDSTASGVIEGELLTITKCGELKVKVTATGNSSYSGAEQTAILTIQRLDLVAGEEESQVHIFISGGFDADGNEYSESGWVESSSHSMPEVRNNLGNGIVTMTYWLDASCTDNPTTEDNGASVEGGIPSFMGDYYIKAEIAESDFYNAITITKSIKIKRVVTCIIDEAKLSITHEDLIDSQYDITQIFDIEDECLSSINRVIYYYEVEATGERQTLVGGKLDIPSISNTESGDRYRIGAIILAKDSSLYVGCGKSTYLKVTKIEVDSSQITIESKDYDSEPCEVSVGHNPYNGEVLTSYFLNEECTEAVTDNDGVPVEAGTYYVKVVVSETNYTKETSKTMQFSIRNVDVNIYWDEDDFVYNGEVQEVKAYYLDLNENPVYLNVSIDKEFKNVQVNDEDYIYTATASFANGEISYVLPDVTTKEYHIKPLEITAEILDVEIYYGLVNYELGIEVTSENKIVGSDKPYELSVSEEINDTTSIGIYEITGECIDSNYDITFTKNGSFRVKNRIVLGDIISDWVWNEEPNTPYAEDVTGSEAEYYYYTEDMVALDEAPRVPGEYYIYARIDTPDSLYWAEDFETFIVDKIEVDVPEKDSTVYVYDGLQKSYKLVDNVNASMYDVSKTTFRNAGTHKIYLTLHDDVFEYYRWPNFEQVYEIDFVINRKSVEKPAEDSRSFKYNGKALTYSISESSDYIVSNNVTQTEVGRYKITVSLVDASNYMWSDGTTDNLVYDFVINQNQIENATITDSKGNKLTTNDASIINVGGGGLSPETELKVEVFGLKDSKQIKEYKLQLNSVLKKYDKIFKVTDVSLVQDGEVIQPGNNVTLKMLVPEELLGADFKLYHIHIDENGKEVVSEINYSDVDENGYIIFQTSNLSAFAFVYKQSSLVGLMVTFIVLTVIMLALLIFQIIWFRKNRSGVKMLTASAVPVFYVASELASTITFGVLFGLLLIANIVFLILNLKMTFQKNNKKKVEKTSKRQAVKESK